MEIGGKDRPIRFGTNQTSLYCGLRGCSVTQYNKDIAGIADGDGSQFRDLFWSALKDGARFNKLEFEHDTFEVGDWLDSITIEQMQEFVKQLIDSMQKAKQSDNKKKAVA